jgi:hypothetical protein
MWTRMVLAICGAWLVTVPAAVAAAVESETLLYARYLGEQHAWDGLDVIADAQEQGGLSLKAGAFIVKQSSKLRIEKWKPTASITAAAIIDGVLGVLKRSPGQLQKCTPARDEAMMLRSCPEQQDGFVTLAALGIPKATVMRIRNSFPYWYSGYTADEAAIIMVVAPEQVPALLNKLRKTRVMDIIGYTVSATQLEQARDLLQPAGPRRASLVTTP